MGPIPTIIGSWATHYWYPEFRDNGDIDCYVAPQFCKFLREKKFDPQAYTRINGLLDVCNLEGPLIEIDGIWFKIATPKMLLAIKRVHISLTLKWLKNISDFVWLAQQGVKIDTETANAFHQRMIYMHEQFSDENGNEVIPEDISPTELATLVECRRVSPTKAAEIFIQNCGLDLKDYLI